MNDAKQKVLDMIEQKKITAAEGDALLAAMRDERRFTFRTLFDPFERLSTGAMLAVGALTALLSVLLTSGLGLPLSRIGGVRFDGFLDVHGPQGAVGVPVAVAEQLAAWPLAALVLWLVSLAFARKSRFVDFLATLGAARLVLFVGGALIAIFAPPREELLALAQSADASPIDAGQGLLRMIPVVAVALVFVGWFVAAAVFAFRHASGLRGGRLAAAFVAALVAAEIVTKISLWGVSKVLGA
jgi:hypothetical protein